MKPHYKIITDSRGIKREVYVQGDPDWFKKELEEAKKFERQNYTREQFVKEGFQ